MSQTMSTVKTTGTAKVTLSCEPDASNQASLTAMVQFWDDWHTPRVSIDHPAPVPWIEGRSDAPSTVTNMPVDEIVRLFWDHISNSDSDHLNA